MPSRFSSSCTITKPIRRKRPILPRESRRWSQGSLLNSMRDGKVACLKFRSDNSRGHLSKGTNKAYTAEDIKYTQDRERLYAIVLDWPPRNEAVITSLRAAEDVDTEGIKSVSLLGYGNPLAWSIGDQGLIVQLPKEKVVQYAHVLKIKSQGRLVANWEGIRGRPCVRGG